ncbi:MAG: hypothetical protein M1358_23805, partial [Chloroflexi bacterium]|nr:hypothetical protein [Chloroflexota bacterium]
WLREERPQDILEINAEIYGRHKLSYLRWNLPECGRFLLLIVNNVPGYCSGRSTFKGVTGKHRARKKKVRAFI